MLTEEQKKQFVNAVRDYSPELFDDEITVDKITATRDTVDDFLGQWGRRRDGERPEVPLEKQSTAYGDVFFWSDIKIGGRRGELYVQDFGEFRAVFFTGGTP